MSPAKAGLSERSYLAAAGDADAQEVLGLGPVTERFMDLGEAHGSP